MTSIHDEYRSFPDLPEDWKVEEYADGDLFAEPEGSRRIEERDREHLRWRQAEIAAERARRR